MGRRTMMVGALLALPLAAQAMEPAQPVVARPLRLQEVIPAPTPTPPPPVTIIHTPNVSRPDVMMVVRVFGGSEPLWDRELRLRDFSGTQVDRKLTEPPPPCGENVPLRYDRSGRTSLELRVTPHGVP